jgi:DNA (cytosine-5)-methyltransferase 1
MSKLKPYTALTIPSMAAINEASKKWGESVSLFSGCGGASVGMKLAGVKVLFANEFISGALRTYRANRSRETVTDGRDVRLIKGEEILEHIGMKPGQLDLLEGSPPCKAFSSASRHNRIGKRADAVVDYSEGVHQRVDDLFHNHIRILRTLKPKITMIENVPGMAESVNIGFFSEICKLIESSGYKLEVRKIDPSRLGVPQRRVRLVFVGIRNDLYSKGLHHVWPKPYATPPITVREIIPEAILIGKGKGEWMDSRVASPTLTVTAGRSDEFSGLSAPPFYQDADGVSHQYSIPQLKKLFSFPEDFRLGGTYHNRYERLGRSHAPLAVYNIVGTMMRRLHGG